MDLHVKSYPLNLSARKTTGLNSVLSSTKWVFERHVKQNVPPLIPPYKVVTFYQDPCITSAFGKKDWDKELMWIYFFKMPVVLLKPLDADHFSCLHAIAEHSRTPVIHKGHLGGDFGWMQRCLSLEQTSSF